MGKKVYIGVGHGGEDSGAVGYGLKEKDLCLEIANYCSKYLLENYKNIELKQSRVDDIHVSVAEKASECNSFNANVAIDIHINAGGGVGAEFYHSTYSRDGRLLAEKLWEKTREITNQKPHNEPVKTKLNKNGNDYFCVVRETMCPFVICEWGFIDNKIDVDKLKKPDMLRKIGIAYAEAIAEFINLKEKEIKNDRPLYKVQAGAFSDENNARRLVNKLQTAGFSAYIVRTTEKKG